MNSIERLGPVALLGECPVWSADEGVLYWIDIEGRCVHRHDPEGQRDHTVHLDGRPGSIVLTDEPGVLVAAVEHELLRLDTNTGVTETIAALEEAGTGNRLNDGRTDPAGRYVVGSMWADATIERHTGVLHSYAADGAHTELRHDIGVTNGLAFDRARGRMFFADTPTETVWVYDYDERTGEASNPQVFVDHRELPGKPDGACVDADGHYWSASVYGWALTRFDPDGRVERRLDLPVEKPSMPAFGGPDLTTLYVTTIGAAGAKPSAPGRDGFEPGELLRIELDDIAGVADAPFG